MNQLDLPEIVQTSSIYSVDQKKPDKPHNQLEDAIAHSKLDKEFRQHNIPSSQIKDGKDLEAIEVRDGQHISLIYYLRQEENNKQQQIEVCQNELTECRRVHLQPYQGTLLKKSPHWFQGYNQKFCKIENRIFRYYSSQPQVLEGVLNFDVQTYTLEPVHEKNVLTEFIIKPTGKTTKIFQFKGLEKEETAKWFEILRQHLDGSLGKTLMLTTLCTYERYWRFERMSTQQVLEEAEDGDLLLFRGKDINCQVQRTFTQSQYDHVAMLVKLENDNLYFFEALPLHGVGLCKWSTFIMKKWYNLYERVVFRKLSLQRQEEFKRKIRIFVTQNIGKSYSLTPAKLFKFQSVVVENKDKQEIIDKQRTYFCSELIAACYKELGLLPKDKSSTQYWPGTFSQENKSLKLNYGELSEEFLIDFVANNS